MANYFKRLMYVVTRLPLLIWTVFSLLSVCVLLVATYPLVLVTAILAPPICDSLTNSIGRAVEATFDDIKRM